MAKANKKYLQKTHHIDARIEALIAKIEREGIPPVFDTPKCAEILEVSEEWLEIGRSSGYGPPYVKPSPKMIRYTARGVLEYLNERMIYRHKLVKQRARKRAQRIIDDAEAAA